MAGSSTSRVSWSAIPRPSGWDWRNWRAGATWTRVAPEKRGWTQTVDRHRPRDRGQLPQGPRGSHRRRPHAARGEVDEPVAAADRQTDGGSGDARRSRRRLPVAPQAPIPQAEGAEEDDDGPPSSGSQRPVREHRPPQEGVSEGRAARDQHGYEEEGVDGQLLP